MAVIKSVKISAELESVGQFDRIERWHGELDVTRAPNGRVRIGQASQSGFAGITVDWDDLFEAVEAIS